MNKKTLFLHRPSTKEMPNCLFNLDRTPKFDIDDQVYLVGRIVYIDVISGVTLINGMTLSDLISYCVAIELSNYPSNKINYCYLSIINGNEPVSKNINDIYFVPATITNRYCKDEVIEYTVDISTYDYFSQVNMKPCVCTVRENIVFSIREPPAVITNTCKRILTDDCMLSPYVNLD